MRVCLRCTSEDVPTTPCSHQERDGTCVANCSWRPFVVWVYGTFGTSAGTMVDVSTCLSLGVVCSLFCRRHPQVRCKEARHEKVSHDLVLTATLYRHVNVKRCACSLPLSRTLLYPESCHCVLVQTPRDCPWPARTENSSPEKPVSWNSTFLTTPSSSAFGTLCLMSVSHSLARHTSQIQSYHSWVNSVL